MDKVHVSVENMWEDYLSSIGESVENTNKSYDSWYFCDSEESANELAVLVKEGVKRGTTSLYDLHAIENEELPKVGELSVITDWNGIAQSVIKVKKVNILPFNEVDEELASIEGEGDKSLEYWQRVHIDFFTRELKGFNMEFSKDMLIVFEEFEVVYK